MARITEGEIAEIVIEILRSRPHGRASIADLVDEIPNRVTLSAEDLAMSPTRSNERVWEQQVRNITSHKNSPSNAIYERIEEIVTRFTIAALVKVSAWDRAAGVFKHA
jgi:hypothetical protein